jgi:DNA-binding PadR family transcriptional regulator
MSFEALAWAGKCKPGSASRKLVLFALADRHNDEVNGSYPSVAWIAEFTDLNRKTIIAALDELERLGLITDSGERRGKTGQVKLYRLHLETVPELERFQKRNSTEISAKGSQKRDTDTVREPSPQKASPSSERAQEKPLRFRMPNDWKPVRFTDATVAREIVDRRGLEWARAALESFRNWAANADDRVGRKHDWQKAWVNWVIEQDRRDGRNGQRNGTANPGGLGRTALAAVSVFGEPERGQSRPQFAPAGPIRLAGSG